MKEGVKRYDPVGYDGLSAIMKEHTDGDYVRAEDYDALRAELERVKQDRAACWEQYKVLGRDYDRLMSELAEVKGREAVAVAYISAKSIERLSDPRIHGTASAIERKPTNGFVPFWLTPPASPDVEGLVNELQRIAEKCSDPDTTDALDTALSTWRQAHTPSTLPASSAEE